MSNLKETATEGIRNQVPTIYDKLKARKLTFQEALPRGSGISAERFVGLALKAVSDSEALRKCSWSSIANALLDCAHLGLEPNSPLHEGAIIPRGGVAIFQPEYRGVLKLVWNSGLVASLDYDRVCENDVFEYEHGDKGFLKHKPKLKDRGEVYAYYACAQLIGGGFAFVVKSKGEIEAHRDRFSDAARKKKGPWITDFDAMAYKTVLLELGDKKLPKRTTNEALLFHRVAVAETSGDLPEGRLDSLDLGEATEGDEPEQPTEKPKRGQKDGQSEGPQAEPEPETPQPKPKTPQFDRREPEPEATQEEPSDTEKKWPDDYTDASIREFIVNRYKPRAEQRYGKGDVKAWIVDRIGDRGLIEVPRAQLITLAEDLNEWTHESEPEAEQPEPEDAPDLPW